MEIGLEKCENLWCIFKKDKGVELWLNKNKKWSKKDDRAGIKDYKKAEKRCQAEGAGKTSISAL
mgnify:CR=1 FL=1